MPIAKKDNVMNKVDLKRFKKDDERQDKKLLKKMEKQKKKLIKKK